MSSIRHRPASVRPFTFFLSALLAGGAALILGAAGCEPAGFQPDNGCAALSSCDLCASRGGCGWCGSSCIPSAGAQCSTGLVQASNLCPGATPVTATTAAPAAAP